MVEKDKLARYIWKRLEEMANKKEVSLDIDTLKQLIDKSQSDLTVLSNLVKKVSDRVGVLETKVK